VAPRSVIPIIAPGMVPRRIERGERRCDDVTFVIIEEVEPTNRSVGDSPEPKASG
jgi:hypothetical protein